MVFLVLLSYCKMWYVLFVVDEVSLSLFVSVAFIGQGPFEKETIVSIRHPWLNKGIQKKKFFMMHISSDFL